MSWSMRNAASLRNTAPDGGDIDGHQESIHEIKAEPQLKAISLITTNRCGFLSASAQASVTEVAEWLEREVEFVASSVAKQNKGIVSLVAADRFFMSFNTVRPCGASRQAAVQCADNVIRTERGFSHDLTDQQQCDSFAELPLTSAVCYGNAACGDFGSASQLQY
eukprot:gene56691-biopygen64446